MTNKLPDGARREIAEGWLALFGEPPEERQEGDMTAQEISELWKIDRNAVYEAVRKEKLIAVKVIDETTGKSITVYRINHHLDERNQERV